MHALNRRPFTLRLNQICQPKDLLRKILVDNFEQWTLDRPSLRYDSFKTPSILHVWFAAPHYKTSRFHNTPSAQLRGFAPVSAIYAIARKTQHDANQHLTASNDKTAKPKPSKPLIPDPFAPSTQNYPCKTLWLLTSPPTTDLYLSLVFNHPSIYHKKVYGRMSPRTSTGPMCLSETRHSKFPQS
jgi:hypothetical protein